ncbi:16S rRNA (cytosine(1402)-N(4))-methyltransferase [Candidatus Berkelbacteria bacterium RIFCSPHIGHO2_12_FULL_36_9]|uniref:Ribosomal RNA small subunit methyltransferase H n=1 Tax=Candidatus Berkelbacteria bacterium RIFCSPHIGHO2_12_FULL_36_9 TaxID=1797469 RepID=A0A1F5EF33_9BACT|nr:MAG: 16S rRNA (cytosine(1402)-N(4))-methyltransferase [Candidatus Berkelbacteria bacterium RIFCSPHIGHO2_12_FULL_36_9]
MQKEVIHYLAPKKNQNFIDSTLGLGGHTQAILDKTAPNGKLLAIEQSEKGLNEAKKNLQKYKNRIVFICNNFRNLSQIVRDNDFEPVSGVLFDLGLASWQIEDSNLGISFTKDMPLDMRLDEKSEISASDILNTYNEKQLSNLFYYFGDIKKNRHLVKKIINRRQEKKFASTADLIETVGSNNPKVLAPIFQSLRIEVNHELENLTQVLPQITDILAPKGKIIVISYHSGEDRIAKNFFRANKDKFKILTKKPLTASFKEIKENSRARSAKLRAGERI